MPKSLGPSIPKLRFAPILLDRFAFFIEVTEIVSGVVMASFRSNKVPFECLLQIDRGSLPPVKANSHSELRLEDSFPGSVKFQHEPFTQLPPHSTAIAVAMTKDMCRFRYAVPTGSLKPWNS